MDKANRIRAIMKQKHLELSFWIGGDHVAHRQMFADLLAAAGVTIDGPQPWDIQVRDERLYARVLRERNLGLGEAYIDGWWDCPRLDEFFALVLKSGLEER